MERLNGHDELLSRIAAVDPAARLTPMTEGSLDRVSRYAMSPMPKPWTWRRFRFASLGALVGSGGLVVAGILGIQAAGQGLPILALGQSAAKSGPVAPGSSSTSPVAGPMMLPYETFQFTSDPSLSSAVGSGTAYELSSSIDASTAASQLAQALSVPGDVIDQGDGSYQVGPDNGPDVSTYTSNGVVNWYYESAMPTAILSPDGATTTTTTTTTSTDSTGPLPTNDQASQEAVAQLGTLGVSNDLGTPSVSSFDTEVDVTIPIVVDGLSTDQTFYVSYGPDSVLNSVSGEYLTATPETTYPTIAPTDAVNVLIAHNGFIFYGGVMPMGAASPANSSSSPGNAPTDTTPTTDPGASSGSGPGDSTTTTVPGDPSTTIPEPVLNVDINQATMQLSSYTLTDGTSWLLPTWALSGPETGTTVSPGDTYSNNVLAVDSQYVQLQPGPMAY
jgi:hypothetical protein